MMEIKNIAQDIRKEMLEKRATAGGSSTRPRPLAPQAACRPGCRPDPTRNMAPAGVLRAGAAVSSAPVFAGECSRSPFLR